MTAPLTAPVAFEIGNENQLQATAKVQTYIIDSEGKEVHVTKADGVVPGYHQTNKNTQPAVDDQPWDVGGGWTSINAEIADGTIVKFFASRKGALGIPTRFATLYRFRQNAPLLRVTMRGTGRAHSTKDEITLFMGRADRISLEEARAYGYSSNPAYEKFFNHPDEDDALTVTEMAAGIAAEPTRVEEVEGKDGEKTYRVRKVELRRIRRRKR